MHIKSVHLKSFKRFSDLTIERLPPTARLVVLCGPNGTGKSSLFDGFKTWHGANAGGPGVGWDPLYYAKKGAPEIVWNQSVEVEFFEGVPDYAAVEQRKRLFYVRSAYRHEADFTITSIGRMGALLDAPTVPKMIDTDIKVADDYQRLTSFALDSVFGGGHDQVTVAELRDRLIGPVRLSMARLFEDLQLRGVGNPIGGGSFYFEKGTSSDFHYKNLSGGEKAAFDLILDLLVKLPAFNDTVFCIDEPELHMNTRLQAALLEEMFRLIPDSCQLWLATHSIGMMRKAQDLKRDLGDDKVVFLDFEALDFDTPTVMTPAKTDRRFWSRVFQVALGDLADLLGPRQVVLCEGKPSAESRRGKAESDADVYRVIFETEYPDTTFISVGNAADVGSDRLRAGDTVQAIASGIKVLRLVDRDDRNLTEIEEASKAGIRVLSLRQLESYLLEDEILAKLCAKLNRPDKTASVLEAKRAALLRSAARSNAADDIKSAAGEIYSKLREILDLRQSGSTVRAFLRDAMAPLVTPDTAAYRKLKLDIFGE